MGKGGRGKGKKRKRGPKERDDVGKGREAPAGGEGGPPDRRAMERAMSEITRLLESREFESTEEMNAFIESQVVGKRFDELGAESEASTDPLREAQDLMYRAWESRSSKKRVALAERALAISPDCADAYNLLAEERARSAEEALPYFEKGVEAGERALGPEVFEDDEGHFWGILKTRPYMRAREGLAMCLERLGREEEAIEHYDEMLRLNPNDNQGVRDSLLVLLLERDERERAGELLERYAEDASAHWLYGRALWLFREEGESEKASAALREALDQNEHVPPYLLGDRKLPRRYPEYVGWGDEREAKAYALNAAQLWRETPGARGWLLREVQKRG